MWVNLSAAERIEVVHSIRRQNLPPYIYFYLLTSAI